MNLPPIFFYAVGTMMSVFGLARAFFLGLRRSDRELAEDTPARAKLRRNHLVWGLIHFVAGIVIILLTTGVIRARSGP
jgi:hypothetical protein